MEKTYAVVDIETTGTDPKKDRIIQFGCVLLEDGEIVSRFAMDINPGQGISKQIQTLTGITNKQVRHAPYFEDVALTIYNLLTDTIFVAHNIRFDYSFLNAELKRCGVPELQIPGIDTVELAQIFFPTESSFRLKTLSESLGLTHDRPHQADSDAEVTAEIFLKIKEKMLTLPLVTLEEIARLSHFTSKDTGVFIENVYKECKEKLLPLPSELEVVDGLALKKKQVRLFAANYYEKAAYPRSKKQKEHFYQHQLQYRKEQSRLMNLVYDHFTQEEVKNLMIEAVPGMGKTIGYLLPLHFLATPENPVIISTRSVLLQDQILNKDVPQLNELLEEPLQAVVMKSPRHYLDLARFKASLSLEKPGKQYALYQMTVLVWLTQTTTGDFAELQMTRLSHPFWQDVCHQGLKYLSFKSAFFPVDFLRHREAVLAQSNVIIVNHAYLAQEDYRQQPSLPSSDFLIIDEAHHLPETIEKVSNLHLNVYSFRKQIMQMIEKNWFEEWRSLMPKDQRRIVALLEEGLAEVSEDLVDFFEEIQNSDEQVFTQQDFNALSFETRRLTTRIQLLFKECVELGEQLQSNFEAAKATYSPQQVSAWGQFVQLLENVEENLAFFTAFVEEWTSAYVHWISKQGLHLLDLKAALLPETNWYARYRNVLYIGGTLQISGDRTYFAKRLGIDAKLKVLPTPFDYAQQARLFVPTDGIAIKDAPQREYVHYLADFMTQLIRSQKRPILVLFTSHDILSQVYHQLKVPFLAEGRDILAQGIGGSREKLLKKFLLSDDSILFGADSFWEGIDLPGELLQIVVVTRLPFENPHRPLIQARNRFLESQGMNPFFQEAVPKAALRLRQALGRLIRQPEDKGVMLVLDSRLTTAKYGKRLLNALPKELSLEETSTKELLEKTKIFLDGTPQQD